MQGVRLQKTGSSYESTINTGKKIAHKITRVLKCTLTCCSWLKTFLHDYHISPKSWLIFRHSRSKKSREKLFFLRESGLWDMFKLLWFWRPALRQGDHVISGLFQGAKWFFFFWLEYKKRLILLERGKYAFLLFLFCEHNSSLWCCWDVKWKSRNWESMMLKLGMLKSRFNCCLCLCYEDLCNICLTREHC